MKLVSKAMYAGSSAAMRMLAGEKYFDRGASVSLGAVRCHLVDAVVSAAAGPRASSRQLLATGLPGTRRAMIAVVRGPKTPRMDAIWRVAGSWWSAEGPSQREKMAPTVQLAEMMELPSRGSKARVYCSEEEEEEGEGTWCSIGRSMGSSSLLAVTMLGHWAMAARMMFSAVTSTLSSKGG